MGKKRQSVKTKSRVLCDTTRVGSIYRSASDANGGCAAFYVQKPLDLIFEISFSKVS